MSTSSTTSTTGTAVSSGTSTRISGLASGIDTESIVTSLMKAENAKYDKLAQQKQLMDWKSDAYVTVNNLLKDFNNTYLSALDSSTSMLSTSAIQGYTVTADSTSNATITANADAMSGTHELNSITSLATGANAVSSDKISSSTLTASTKLNALSLTNALTFGSDNTLSFAINGKTFSFKSTDTLQEVLNTVNSDTTANVSMSYSSLTGKISVKNKDLGSDSSLKIENITGNAFADTNAAFGIAQGTSTNGTDAVLQIDGVDVTKDSNSFTIDGISYNLKYTTSTSTKFSVDQDVDGAVTKVKNFVTAYNTLIDKLQGMIDEEKDSDYAPLTDTQKAAMSETQITQWETKAKTGILEDDSYISKLLSDMRSTFYDKVAGAGTNAASIGLSTISYLTKGDITVDESKLRTALQTNPQQVAKALTSISYETDNKTKYSESGVASRISTIVSNYLSDANGYRKTSTSTQYTQLTDSMTTMKTQLTAKENRYWTQFTAMETAISKMNAQSSWLSAQFSSNS
jgi:flagellar hook-associated protein 2